MPCNCFRYGSEDHLIEKCPNLPKYNDEQQNQVIFSERGNCASKKEYENDENKNDQKIYVSMARISVNDKCPSRDFGDSSQLTNWILDSGKTYHMVPQVSDFIPGLLEDMDKHIEFAGGHHVTAKKKDKCE